MSNKLKFTEHDMKRYKDASYIKTCGIPPKEFFETMHTIRKGIPIVKKYHGVSRLDMVHDFCSGHTFNAQYILARNQSKYVTVIDKRFPNAADHIQGYYQRFASRLITRQESIFDNDYDISGKSLVLSIHPCNNLSYRVIEIAVDNNLPVVLVPCCIPKRHDSYIDAFTNLSPYQKHEMKLCDTLVQNNYDISIKKIGEHVTARNTIIIGLPNNKGDSK